MQQVLDFAGNMENFDFEWKISPPINGKPPSVYKYDYISLLSKNEDWHHMHFPGNSQINKYNEVYVLQANNIYKIEYNILF